MKKQHSRLMGSIAGISVLSLLIALALACGGEDAKPAQADLSGKVGEKITTGQYEITVPSVKARNAVGGAFLSEKPAEGGVFVVVHFSSKNTTSKPISSYELPSIKLIDPNNVSYDNATGAAAAYAGEANLDTKAFSDLNPGITQKDADVFEVSRELWNKPGWKIMVDADKDIAITVK